MKKSYLNWCVISRTLRECRHWIGRLIQALRFRFVKTSYTAQIPTTETASSAAAKTNSRRYVTVTTLTYCQSALWTRLPTANNPPVVKSQIAIATQEIGGCWICDAIVEPTHAAASQRSTYERKSGFLEFVGGVLLFFPPTRFGLLIPPLSFTTLADWQTTA